jgi:uncharacterized repeat protein (TIGR03843 family)
MDLSPFDATLDRLREAELTVLGVLTGASNHTLLVRMDGEDRFAVYKPQRGERPLWDFPSGTLYQREVAAFEVSRFLGWDLVPPTVVRDGPFGVGSVQQFVVHDPQQHYFTLIEDTRTHVRLAQLATFDLLINNADRKGGHVLRVVERDCLLGIDHGLTFHIQPKLRTVIWDLGGSAITQAWRDDLRRLSVALAGGSAELACLRDLLSSREIAALRRRADRLATAETLPDVAPDRRPYPWPPL